MIRYVTRWALTAGIKKVDGRYTEDKQYFHHNALFVSAKEAFETLEEAQEKAREMADKKVLSLQKQAAKFADPKWKAKVAP